MRLRRDGALARLRPEGHRRQYHDTRVWVATERGADSITLRVYSFGPNRRRDGAPLSGGGDDIGAPLVIRP